MTHAHRDLASHEYWIRSLERSRRRRELLLKGRREHNRRKHLSAALATAVVAGPSAPLAAAQVSGNVSAAIAAESPANRAIEIREGGLPLQTGSQGELVAHVQKALRISADGVFGPQTDAAVRGYQAAHGLQVDGIVGLATWGSLFAQSTSSGASVGGSDVPAEVKQRVAQRLETAGQDLAADGRIDGDAGLGGSSPESAPPEPAPPASVPGPDSIPSPYSTPAPAPRSTPVKGGGEACGSTTIANPVRGTVTSPYGPRWGRNHDGIDIGAPTGTPVRAAACGTVSLADHQSGYGNMVCITHTPRFSTCYAHLSRFGVSNGAQVRQGQVIGYVGCTGSCTGPHLHFETRVGGRATNPSPYLNGSSIPGKRASVAGTASVGGPDLPREVLRQAAREASRTTATAAVGGGAVAVVGGQAVPRVPETVIPVEAVAPTTATGDGTVTYETPAAPVSPEAAPAEGTVTDGTVTGGAVVAPPEAPVTDGTVTYEAPVAPVPAEPVAGVPVEAAPVDVAVEAAPVETAPVEAAPVEAAPVEVAVVPAPVEPAPAPIEPVAEVAVETAPVESAPAEVAVEAPAAEVAPDPAAVSGGVDAAAAVSGE